MLPFKKPSAEIAVSAPDNTPRWKVGIEKERVAVFVGVALIAGFLFGYTTARFMIRVDEERVAAEKAKVEESAREKTDISQPAAAFYRVNRILRGDIVEVEKIGAVRLIGVETPDGMHPAETYATPGKNALAFTEQSLLNQEVRLEFDPAFAAKDNKDLAGQTLAYLYTSDGKLFNAELVKQGHAFVREESFAKLDDFRGYTREAMAAMRGLWGMNSSATASTTPATASTTAPGSGKTGKLSPMQPSEIGPNIPAASGTTTAVTTDTAGPMVYVSAPEKIYHKSGCERLGKKRQLLPLSHAKSSGYIACGRCFPSTSMKAN